MRLREVQTVPFTFDGVTYRGVVGETLAAALIANGVKLVARSFKYHRPRGVMGSGSEEPNALVTIGRGAAADGHDAPLSFQRGAGPRHACIRIVQGPP